MWLSASPSDSAFGKTARHASPLARLLVDDAGEGMTPTHAVKNGKRYG